MTDAGFFRGTSSDQDNRFANKQKKLLKELNFSPILNTKLNMSKIDVDSLKPWIEEKIKDILEKEDDLLSDSIFEHLAEKEPDGKNILVLITGFVDETKASKFMEELWTKLIDLQDNSNGVTKSTTTTATNNTDKENPLKESDDVVEKTTKSDEHSESKNNFIEENARKVTNADDHQSSASSRSESPPSRSVSKSPGNHKLDERSRGRPRKRLQDEVSREGSSPPTSDKKRNRSRSKSSSRSRSASISKRSPDRADGQRRGSRSSSRSKRSGSKRSESKSRSRSYSRSGSRSRSKSKLGSRSNSRSPRPRSRSPYSNSYRGRRSRSRDRGYRPRSRSPRGRRGYIPRGPYRGSFGSFHDSRRRGTIGGPLRRRPSPWSSRARRYSPRSPLRRRRTPSFSPRRRRSPSPYGRRLSRSRSPVPVMRGPPSPPRRTMPGGHMDMMASRHVPHHDVHRPIMPVSRSPRGHIYHRSYGESQILTRHSPGPSMGIKQPDLPALSHGPISGQPGPSTTGMYSPTSSRKKHKKEKKHRKHKKSKKHRSPSPEKKKKHKKHKKTKKHKSH